MPADAALERREIQVLLSAEPGSDSLVIHGGDAWAMHRARGNVRHARRLVKRGLLSEQGKTTTVDGIRFLADLRAEDGE